MRAIAPGSSSWLRLNALPSEDWSWSRSWSVDMDRTEDAGGTKIPGPVVGGEARLGFRPVTGGSATLATRRPCDRQTGVKGVAARLAPSTPHLAQSVVFPRVDVRNFRRWSD